MLRILAVGLLVGMFTHVTRGQEAPIQVTPETEVENISFAGNPVFAASRLQENIATSGPSFLNRLMFWQDRFYPFDPIELEKDKIRLERFYRRHGFLHPQIEYAVELDRDDNSIDAVFTIEPGPPLLIQDVTFVGADSTRPAREEFPARKQEEWENTRDQLLDEIGGRFESSVLVSLETELQRWLQNAGYPFARVTTDTSIVHRHTDETDVDDVVYIHVQVEPGPLAQITEFDIQGNTSLDRASILRNVPVEIGEQFSQEALAAAQHQLFSLNLFRMALVDVPPQPRDSTVTVRIRLQEAEPRYVSAQTGYSLAQGIDLEGQWRHRNFMGEARNLIISANWSTGLGAFQRLDVVVPNHIRFGTSLRQPYLFIPRLSAVVSMYYDRREQQAFALQQYGLNTTFIYDFYRFRTLSLEHTFSRAAPLETALLPAGRFFNRSAVTLSGRFGQANDYINPNDGFLIEPFVEVSDQMIGSALEYTKLGIEGSVYEMVSETVGVASRLFVGRLFPYGTSADQDDPVTRARFSSIRFYAGGANDVRGWHNQLLGPKQVDQDTSQYTPLGGRAKFLANFEVRLPFPFLGNNWGTTTFIDAGYIGTEGFQLDPTAYRYGAGGGIRYATAVGPLRFDVAYKLNPSSLDVRPPRPGAEPSFWRRVVFYFTIGNPF